MRNVAFAKGNSIQICQAWNDNFEEEFALIREIFDDFRFTSHWILNFLELFFVWSVIYKNSNDYHYQTLKDNVEASSQSISV
ncbi:putative ribonuclease H superfamily, CCR4-NOT transcription complex subunit/Pop2 [Helianthus anomalus]